MESKLGGRLLLSVVRTAHTPPTSFRTKKTMINDDTKRKSDAPSCCFLVFLARQFKKARRCCVDPTGIRPPITDREDRSGRRIWAHRPVQSTSLVGEDPYPPTVRPRSPVFCSLAGFGIFRLEGATGLVRGLCHWVY